MGLISIVDDLLARARELHPGKSDDWYRAFLGRLAHYHLHDGDMTEAPGLPDE